jgi:hypothetical protein
MFHTHLLHCSQPKFQADAIKGEWVYLHSHAGRILADLPTEQTLTVQPDPLHLFMRAWRSTSTAEIVKESKGLTSHELGKEYRILKRLPSHWMWAYFTATVGNVSTEAMQYYIVPPKGV